MTANVIPFPLKGNIEPIISSDYFGSEKFLLTNILDVLDSLKEK